MKAVKGNKVYTINEMQRKFYEESGFDILDDNGAIIAYGRGKIVSYGEYMALKEKEDALKKECAALKEEKAALEKEYAVLKEQLEAGAAKETKKQEDKGEKASKAGE